MVYRRHWQEHKQSCIVVQSWCWHITRLRVVCKTEDVNESLNSSSQRMSGSFAILMMTSCHGNYFRIIDPECEIPRPLSTKGEYLKKLMFFCCETENTLLSKQSSCRWYHEAHWLAPPTTHREFVAWWVWTVLMAYNGKFNVIRQHIRTLNRHLIKDISHAHRRTTTFPPIPPPQPDWIIPKPVTSYTRIHRVAIRRVELCEYFFGSPEWIHCLAPSTAHGEFVAWCVLTVPMA